MEQLLQDVRFAVRSLLRSPGFTALALLALALAIGANTAIFSIVNGVLLRPLDYPRPEQLMHLTTQFPALGLTRFWLSPPEYFELRELNRSFSNVGVYRAREVNLTEGDRPVRVRAAFVDGGLLNVLGVPPEHGRLFTVSETDIPGPPPAPGQPPLLSTPIAMLSHELWQTAFGGRPVLGQRVEIDGQRHEIVGVMPAGFDVADNRTEIWLPIRLNPANRLNRAVHLLYAIGRLKEGVTARMAEAELKELISSWDKRVGLSSSDHVFSFTPRGNNPAHFLQMKALQEEVVGGARRSIWTLQAAVGFVLLIACANLANLLLARAETRRRELAVLTALGASRWRLLRQFMTEGVLLSVGGGILGVLLARSGLQVLMRAFPESLPRTNRIDIDPLVLLFTFAVATATGLLFGLAPMVHTRASDLVTALKESGARGATSGMRHHLRNGLVIAEVAVAVVLTVGAGLLVRTVYNLVTVDAGFDRDRLVTFAVTLPEATYANAAARGQLYEKIVGGLRALPGVQGVTAMSGLPPRRPVDASDIQIANYSPTPGGPIMNVDHAQAVMFDYFETMGIPIVQGRGFQPADAASPALLAVVNETFVNTFWKGQNPIGQRVRQCCVDQMPWLTVIGVAKDVKQGGIDQKTGTEIYGLVEQMARVAPGPTRSVFSAVPFNFNFVLRTSLAPAVLSRSIERVVHGADGTVPVVRLREMDAVFAESIRRPTLVAQLIGTFAALALLLAAIGTYGVLSLLVAERRQEIGVRLALGADRGHMLARVMGQGLLLAGIGVVIGLAGAFGLNRLIASLLFGVQPADTVTMLGVVALILLVAALACLRPAWRASRLDPNAIFRTS
jgi:putative ABC transport system permease protein